MGSPTSLAPTPNTAQTAVRRIIVYAILFALVIIAAIGVAGLLGRLLETGGALAGDDATGLAESLAFALVGTPFAALLWRVAWKALEQPTERTSIAWALYIAGAYIVSLVVFVTGFVLTATAAIDGRWEPRDFATGVVWLGVWWWHRWMSRHPLKAPTRLTSLPIVAGWVFGLIVGIGGSAAALRSVVSAAMRSLTELFALGEPWWMSALQDLVWGAAGVLVWWWHWMRFGRRDATGLSSVAVVVAGVLAPTVMTVGGIGLTIFLALRLGLDRPAELEELLEPLDGLPVALVGALVWAYYAGVARHRSEATRESIRLVVSGVGLAATATGIGVTVNAVLASLSPALAGTDARTLLLGGISALVVGVPVWWVVWRPGVRPEASRAASMGRRVYLIAVFGISAVVALITLIVIGYRVFEFFLDNVTGEGLIERTRAPIGLLIATALAAGYHFSVWRRDRTSAGALTPRTRSIAHVYLVSGSDIPNQQHALEALTGAKVTVWQRAQSISDAPPSDEQFAHALDGVSGNRVVVVVGPAERIDVIPLAD